MSDDKEGESGRMVCVTKRDLQADHACTAEPVDLLVLIPFDLLIPYLVAITYTDNLIATTQLLYPRILVIRLCCSLTCSPP
jgi:hypothetical protein